MARKQNVWAIFSKIWGCYAVFVFLDTFFEMVRHAVCLQAEFNRTKLIIPFSRLVRLSHLPSFQTAEKIKLLTETRPPPPHDLNLSSLLPYGWPLSSLNNETIGAGYNTGALSTLVLSFMSFLTDHLQLWCFSASRFVWNSQRNTVYYWWFLLLNTTSTTATSVNLICSTQIIKEVTYNSFQPPVEVELTYLSCCLPQ